MTYYLTQDEFFEISQGNRGTTSIVHKFGKHEDVQTTYEPLAIGGIYNTPQVSGAVALRVKAGNMAATEMMQGYIQSVEIQGRLRALDVQMS